LKALDKVLKACLSRCDTKESGQKKPHTHKRCCEVGIEVPTLTKVACEGQSLARSLLCLHNAEICDLCITFAAKHTQGLRTTVECYVVWNPHYQRLST